MYKKLKHYLVFTVLNPRQLRRWYRKNYGFYSAIVPVTPHNDYHGSLYYNITVLSVDPLDKAVYRHPLMDHSRCKTYAEADKKRMDYLLSLYHKREQGIFSC